MMKKAVFILLLSVVLGLYGQDTLHSWSFDEVGKGVAMDQVSGISDPILGYFDQIGRASCRERV